MASSNPSRVDRQLAASKRARYVNSGQAAKLLDGLLPAARIRKLALEGAIKGALLIGGSQVLIPRSSVEHLVVPLDTGATSEYGGMTRIAPVRPKPTFGRQTREAS